MPDHHPHHGLSRRRLLTIASAVTTGIAGATTLPQPASAAPPTTPGTDVTTTPGTRPTTTQNHWPIIDAHHTRTFQIEGSDTTVTLRCDTDQPGDAALILLHVARRIHYELTTLTPGDIHGHTTDRTTGTGLDTNYRSGTAITIRPGAYPPGTTGNLYPHEVATIRDILLDCQAVVRWGGDDPTHPSEGHFQIDVPPNDPNLTRVAATIRDWHTQPGHGAGAPAEPSTPNRRSAAQALAHTQRR